MKLKLIPKAQNGLKSKKPSYYDYVQQKVDSVRQSALDKSLKRKSSMKFENPDDYSNFQDLRNSLVYNYENPIMRERISDELEEEVEALQNGYQNRNNSIYTATDNYGDKHRTSSIEDFSFNPSQFGFKEVLSSPIPGDIVVDSNWPFISLIYNGQDKNGVNRFNYSPGKYPQYYKNSQYKTHRPSIYRFTGTKSDSINWKKEYDEKFRPTVLKSIKITD